MKNNHEIILKQYAAYCKEQPLYLGTAGSYGMEMLTIIREGVWAEYDILAAFHPPVGAAVQVRVGANNQIGVPIEATAEKGMGEIVFAGYKEGVRQIAVDVLYKVAPSSGASGTESAEPTPDVVQQILSAASNAEKIAKSVHADAEKIKERLDGISKIDDTAITTTSSWSSKNIVDMLCPPLEESGNPVVCYPVAGYPLGVKAKWEPVQEGSGTPSPENIRPIKGRDSVTVERCGENLLNIKPFNKFTNKGITYEYVPDGGIHISGTALASVDSPVFPIWHLPPGKYCGMDSGAGIFASIVMQRNGKNLWLNAKGAFEILAGDVTKYLYFVANAGVTVDKTIYPYIVPGTTAPTTYKPYISQTNTLILPETVYGGEVDAVTGDGKQTWEIIDNYAGETIPREWISDRDVYSADKNPTVGAQVAYRLAEPVPFTAAGAQPIPALSGTNALLTDADSVSVSGRADLIHIIKKIQEK